MMLRRLVEYANTRQALIPPFYRPKSVRWLVDLSPDGSLASPDLIDLADAADSARRGGVPHVVPDLHRTGGAVRPYLGADTVEYTLGWARDPARTAKAAAYHAAYRNLVARWQQADPASSLASALDRFYQDGHVAALRRPPELEGSHLVAFRVGGAFVHDTESARRFWALEAGRHTLSSRTGVCLVCARPDRLLQTIPVSLPARLAPGATKAAALVSFNKPTHAFALQRQLVHTPICVRCGLQAMSALESLLDGSSSSQLPGQDARLAWWVTGQASFTLKLLDDADPGQVAVLLSSAARGRYPAAADFSMFYAMAVGGNIARVVVREWIELPLPRVQANLVRWFTDHEIVDAWSGQPRHSRIGQLARVTGRWIPGRDGERGAYARFGTPGADRPDGIQRALLRTALLNRPLPPSLLAHLLHRIRTDRRLDTQRAALIRLALVRRPDISKPEAYMPTLNPDHHQPAYLAGRLFAVLEDLQRSAERARGGEALSATFADRYFARAVTSPAVALVAGRRDARAWLKRLRRDRPGWAAAGERCLDELFAQLADAGGMPHGATLADQAAFILGYHQQRAHFRTDRANTTPPAQPQPATLDEPRGASA